MYYYILIAVVGLLALLLLVKKQRDERKASAVTFVESTPRKEFRVLEVTGMTEAEVEESMHFAEEMANHDEHRPTAHKTERHGNTTRLLLDARLDLYGFAVWVNNFVFASTVSEPFEVHGIYPVGTATLDDKDITNTALVFYTPESPTTDDASCAFFHTKASRHYRYDLGYDTISKIDQ